MRHSDFKNVRIDKDNGYIDFYYCGIPHLYAYKKSDCYKYDYYDENEGEHLTYQSIYDMPISLESEQDDLICLLKDNKKGWQVNYSKHKKHQAIKRFVTKNTGAYNAKVRIKTKQKENSVGITYPFYTVLIKIDSEIVSYSSFSPKQAIQGAIDIAKERL